MRISFNKKDLEKINGVIKKQFDRVENLQPFLKSVSILMYQSVMRNFREEGTDKEKWKPLSALTIALRQQKKKGDIKILQDTGYLRNSITPIVTKDSAIVGTNVEYAPLHQFGGKVEIPARLIIPKKKKVLRFVVDGKVIFAKKVYQPKRIAKVPARPFLWIRKEYQEKIFELARRWFGKGEI